MSRAHIISLLLLVAFACQPDPIVPPEDDPAEPVEQPEQPGQPETPPENPPKPGPTDVTVGEPLPLWQDGYLDIHSINGGRGESFYYIMPDGTTMLVDAAGAADFET
ncbi:MAG: hypothetical protein IKZ51_06835 [Bacteroidales bacterium]|nr:hypothetical protein [Bacteroidales bacterium]